MYVTWSPPTGLQRFSCFYRTRRAFEMFSRATAVTTRLSRDGCRRERAGVDVAENRTLGRGRCSRKPLHSTECVALKPERGVRSRPERTPTTIVERTENDDNNSRKKPVLAINVFYWTNEQKTCAYKKPAASRRRRA